MRDPFGLKAWAMACESVTAAQVGDDDRARELMLRVERTPWRASRGLEADMRGQMARTLLMLRDPKATEAAVELTTWAAEHGYHFVELWGHDLVAIADPKLVRAPHGTAARVAERQALVDAPIAGPLAAHIRAIIDEDPALEQAAAAQLGQLGHWVPRQSSSPSALSRRESEVAALVAAGLSSPAIAERLHLSTRTVEAHVSRVFAKLGVNRRSQLADALRKHTA
ncbi:response regulator transcription factor [Aeromicrobium sp. UC242_57]|uniref:response regulator transcription factor n=1 Tax=Aeromicrobium sp. UC242_57 TaxID=3374624 RepID=UPI0037B2CBDF